MTASHALAAPSALAYGHAGLSFRSRSNGRRAGKARLGRDARPAKLAVAVTALHPLSLPLHSVAGMGPRKNGMPASVKSTMKFSLLAIGNSRSHQSRTPDWQLRQSAAANAQAAAQSAPIQSRYRAHRRLPIAATFYGK